ncbi:MAG: tetratricopeptide repeat protein [Desulfobacteraceae bacterium]|nr:tetratricopeptide repeat protein [Desulfobacteraceae bacterium]
MSAKTGEYQMLVSRPSHIEQEFLQRGITSHHSGQIDEAIHWYRKTINIQPENAMALSSMGFALQTIGKLDEAVTSCLKARYEVLKMLKKKGKINDTIIP